MAAAENDNPALELALLGTPPRVVEAVVPSAQIIQEFAELRETLGVYGLGSVQPVSPPPGLRARIVAALEARRSSNRQAVVVLDMIQDYLTEGHPLFVPRARQIVDALAKRIDQARAAGDPVVYVHDFHEKNDPDLEHWPLHAVEGTRGWMTIDELAPREGDVIVKHRTYSGFFETDLHEQLQRLSVDKLLMTGCATELQLFTTAADGLMRGYQVEVVPGCHAGGSEEAENAALRVLSVMRPTPARL